MPIIEHPQRPLWQYLTKRPEVESEELESKIQEILTAVKKSGDAALINFTSQFDGIDLTDLIVSKSEWEEASHQVSEELKSAISLAKSNIEKFHSAQKETVTRIETTKGVTCWRESIPIEKVGLYVPGGTAPLFSTVLMLGIPARLAGCSRIVLCTPAQKDGSIHPAILYTAHLVGIHEVFKVGGAQAIAAMAYGTDTVPKVNKIFGPGNAYVTAAKQMVNQQGVAIDLPAGPSEVAILADQSCQPAFVASEILSQCEHGSNSQAIAVCTHKNSLDKILSELQDQFEHSSRKDFVLKGLKNSKAILIQDMKETIAFINEYAPEHLVIQTKEEMNVAMQIKNAGSVFIGNYTPVAAGDYGSGTNHTLPTSGYAKSYSGVSLDSFLKKITFQHISQEGINTIGPAIIAMAEAEGLHAHKNSVALRINKH
ncbi:MAG: histidinol dehydrogenase [Cytophagaceae bacterium]|nr:histidinol dehydrogenase [Cytophagaceae bacterium]